MKNFLLILLISLLTFSSCKKNRTYYLTSQQKDIINYFYENKEFTLIKNNTDTLNFEVTNCSIDITERSRWWNLGSETWYEGGGVQFVNTDDKSMYGEITVGFTGYGFYFEGLILDQCFYVNQMTVDSVKHENVYVFIEDANTNETMYFSLKEGIFKIVANSDIYLKPNIL
jgi:hypothetical protein